MRGRGWLCLGLSRAQRLPEGSLCLYLCSGPATAAWGTWFSTVTLEERGLTRAQQTSSPKLTPHPKRPAPCPDSGQQWSDAFRLVDGEA